jgi:hypothetical protein
MCELPVVPNLQPIGSERLERDGRSLALQLHLSEGSESMGNHDSEIVDAGGVD